MNPPTELLSSRSRKNQVENQDDYIKINISVYLLMKLAIKL